MEAPPDFENMPNDEVFREIFSTWKAVDDVFRKYFAKEAGLEEVEEKLNAHTAIIPEFINEYLKTTEDEPEIAIVKLHQILIPLHQEPFRACIQANGLAGDVFKLLTAKEVVERGKKLVKIVQDHEEQGQRVDIPGSMQAELNTLLASNTTALLSIPVKRYEREHRIEIVKSHALDIGKTAAGVFVGLSAFALLKRLEK